jgi:diguanylate cyclase (GGDEF)-like protein
MISADGNNMTENSDALSLIERSLYLIEKNLDQPMKSTDVFRWLGVSKSAFTPLFKAVTGYPLNQYIRFRRLSEIAYRCFKEEQQAYLIAQQYQYESSEAFYRAFKRYFGMSVTQYRLNAIDTQLFAPIQYTVITSKGNTMIQKEMNRDFIDIALSTHPGSVLIDVDIDHFMTINDKFGFSIGDAVLALTLLKIKQVCDRYPNIQGPWRYGNDEFLLVTQSHAKEITDEILKAFETPLNIQQQDIDVSISIGTAIIAEDSISRVQNSMLLAKKQGRRRADVSNID